MSSEEKGTAQRWLGRLETWPRPLHGTLASLLVAVFGAVDYWTGYEYAASVFYLLPVAYVAWYLGRRWGYAFSVLAAATWQVANIYAGEVRTHPAVFLWNAATLVGFFAVTAALLDGLRRRLEFEKDLSRTDPTTGVLNPRGFGERLEAVVTDAHRFQRPFTLLYLDADGFKAVNDTLGHSAGDTVLKAAAQALRKGLRGSDAAGRLGGDEFAVVLPDTDEEGARTASGKILGHLREAMAAGGWGVTFSAGCATFASAPSTGDAALQTADGLMFQAKGSGPGRIRSAVVTASPGP